MDLQSQGRAQYKRGEYRKAIELFDQAVGRNPESATAQLLDNRAACYEKLNELSTALKDAKRVIQLHREDATGYLRAGKLLLKMEKPSVALEIYAHGLKCIKHVGKGYELLKKAHDDTQAIVAPPKAVDPLLMLPRELAESILLYLTFPQRINACRVSKGWAQFIRSVPTLWSHLDLSGAKKKVRPAFVSRAINVGREKITRATLSQMYDSDKALRAIFKYCPIEELT
jgi:F-box/TPR repeat protein Pof3